MHEKNSFELKERTNVGVMTQQHRALGNAAPHFKSFSEGRAAAYSIFELINLVPPIDADDISGRTLDKVEGNLELRNIDFAYPSRTEAPIFQNFSLRIPAGIHTEITNG
jgi:ATP-binding cassette subfamily B (MDR/TAP) protein 1